MTGCVKFIVLLILLFKNRNLARECEHVFSGLGRAFCEFCGNMAAIRNRELCYLVKARNALINPTVYESTEEAQNRKVQTDETEAAICKWRRDCRLCKRPRNGHSICFKIKYYLHDVERLKRIKRW